MVRVRVALPFLALLSIPSFAQEIDLTPKFEAGSSRYVEVCQDQEQAITGAMVPEGGIKVKTDSCYAFLQKVESANDKGAKLKLTIDRAFQSMSHSMMGEMKFDSDAPAAADGELNTLAKIFKPWVGRTLGIETDGHGMATKVDGYDALLDAMEDSAGGDTQFEMMKASFTADDFKSSYHDARFIVFPNKKVKVGDTWTCLRKENDSTFGQLQGDYKCKLEKLDGGVATISYTAAFKNPDGYEAPANGVGMKPILQTWTVKGEMTVDKGEPVKQAEEHNVNMDLLFSQAGQGEQKLGVKMLAKTTVRTMDEKARGAQKAENGAAKTEKTEKKPD